MSTLVIDHRNVTLDYEGSCLLIRQPEQQPRSIPLRQLQRILVMHNTQVNTRLIGHCQRHGIDFIVINSRHTENCFSIHANHIQQAARRMSQYRISSQPELGFVLAQRLLRHKLTVSRHCLRRHSATAADAVIARLAHYQQEVRRCGSMEQLRGHEGNAQRQVFEHWRQCLPQELGFTRRARRPPPDPVNALLSLTYTLVYQEAIRQCLAQGLDPWLGFYHQLAPSRMSLACDLMEPLRPLVESWTVTLFTQKEFDRRHFSYRDGGCLLGKQGRELYYTHWHTRLPEWSRRLRSYARLLARYLSRQSMAGNEP